VSECHERKAERKRHERAEKKRHARKASRAPSLAQRRVQGSEKDVEGGSILLLEKVINSRCDQEA